MFEKSIVLIPLLSLAALPALAQQPPTAGQLLQQAQPQPRPPLADAPPTVVEEKGQALAAQGERFVLRGVRLSGQQAYTEAELLALVQDGIGKALNLAELEALAQRITDRYRRDGYLVARAYLPPQSIDGGVVHIAVLEGRVGAVHLNNAAGVAGTALAPLQRIRPGDAVSRPALEEALLRLADVPGVEVKSTLRPGESVGASDFLVDVLPGRAFGGGVDFDNFGNRYVGAGRLGASLYWNNPAGLGDQFSLRVQGGAGDYGYGRIGYQLPVGPHATRVGVAYSGMRYALGKAFAALDADGRATVASLYLQQPLLRSRAASWVAALQYDGKRLRDDVGAAQTRTERTLHNVAVSLRGEFTDGWGGGGSSSVDLGYTHGLLRLDAASAAIDAASARSEGRFGKWTLGLQRQQRLPGDWLLAINANAQRAGKNLDGSEKLSLGGATGVRAYPQGEASGDSGHVVNLELRRALAGPWEAFGFYDLGRVRVNHSPWDGGGNGRRLAGYGVGLAYTGAPWRLQVFAAWKDGTGAAQSDVDRSPRVWAQAAFLF